MLGVLAAPLDPSCQVLHRVAAIRWQPEGAKAGTIDITCWRVPSSVQTKISVNFSVDPLTAAVSATLIGWFGSSSSEGNHCSRRRNSEPRNGATQDSHRRTTLGLQPG